MSSTSNSRGQRQAGAASRHLASQEAAQEEAAAASDEQNNNSLSGRPRNGDKAPTITRQGGGGGGLLRKRSSVQSNLSAASGRTNASHNSGGGGGGSHSLSSSTTSTSNEDEQESGGAGNQSSLPPPPRMSNAEYEHIRNTTLLFFLDRLYLASQEGKEARTLHDLSCLFGTREFTKEMRQIVGASRNGLKKFLQSYPSLFQIEGDKVHLTQLKQDTQVAQRDYNKEAVEYFKQKLLQFGTSLVPIKNLFGYRSQASQEVRHVSGKNSREFKQFLALNADVFEILADEHVVLKTALRELESQGQTSLSLSQSLQPLPVTDAIVMDPYLNKQFAHLVEDCLRAMTRRESGGEGVEEENDINKRVSLEQLYAQIQKQCQNELFLKMVKSLDDLRVFLRMHPKLFKRFRCGGGGGGDTDATGGGVSQEFVRLVSESERRELEAHAYPATLLRQHSSLVRTTSHSASPQAPQDSQVEAQAQVTTQHQVSSVSPPEEQYSSLPPIGHSSTSTSSRRQAAAAAAVAPIRNHYQHQEDRKTQEQQPKQAAEQTKFSRQGSSLSSHQLRANAPPFVPPSRKEPAAYQRHDNHQVASLPTSHLVSLHRQSSSLAHSPYGNGTRQPATIGSGGAGHQRPGIQRSVSNLNPAAAARHHNYQHEQQATYHPQQQADRRGHQAEPPLIDHRSAIRNYLMKDSHQQHGGSNNNMSWSQHQVTSCSPGPGRADSLQQQQQQRQQRQAVQRSDDMRARTIDMVREASNIITKIMTCADAVAFDCKGYNLGFDGQITLIQFGYLPSRSRQPVDPDQLASSISTGSHHHLSKQQQQQQKATTDEQLKPEVCVFDLITNPELAYCLKPLLESDKIVKIVHDVRNKSNALYVQFKIILNNVFDTQVANLVIQQQDTGKPAYKSRYISMSKLCEIYGSDELMKYRNLIKLKTSRTTTTHSSQTHNNNNNNNNIPSQQGSSSSSKDINYWRARPLTKPMIYEATMDVYCLVGGIYQNLKSMIKPEYEPLFDQLNLEGVLARIRPEEIRSAKKERKIDLEVIDLKRKLYGDSLGPVVLSNREIRLLRHIDLTDEVRQKIQQCKKVAKKLERLDMKAAMLLEAKQQQRQQQQQDAGRSSASSSVDYDDAGEQEITGNFVTSDRLSRRQSSSTGGSNQSSLTSNHGRAAPADESLSDAERQLKSITSKLDELNATGMMMDSSMFDELKDKMIESSTLLESLEDDDDDEEAARLSMSIQQHQHLTSDGPDSNSLAHHCHCQCHGHHHATPATHTSERDKLKETEPTSTHEHQTISPPPTIAVAAQAEPETAQQVAVSEQKDQEVAVGPPSALDTTKDAAVPVVSGSKVEAAPEEDNKVNVADGQVQSGEPAHNSLASSSDDSRSSVACDMAVQCDLLTSG